MSLPSSPASDEELLLRWRQGDRASGAMLYDRHAPSVVRFFRNKVGAQCDDLVQQTFEACLQPGTASAPKRRFRAYLLGIARNKLYDHLYRRRGRGFEIDGMTRSVADLDPTPSSVVARNERDQQLAWALRSIPLELQLLLELHYWEAMSTAELAEVLGIAQGTVKTRLMRARTLLRERLAAAPGIGEVPTAEGLETWARGLRDQVDSICP